MRPAGYGIGLRTAHYPVLLNEGAGVPVVEAISENFMDRGGRPRAVLERVRQDAELLLHGVSLSIGGLDAILPSYLAGLNQLIRNFEPRVVSDHLCFGTYGGHFGHDLWPLPFTEEALAHVVQRVQHVQEQLGRQLALENVSSYVTYSASTLTEWEFLAAVAERADCLLLLDVNNVYVSAQNHGFDALQYLGGIPPARVAQYHLAGHRQCEGYLLDDHGSPVPDPVWLLFGETLQRVGERPTIVEWDEHVPELPCVVAEAERAARLAQAFRDHRAAPFPLQAEP